MWMRLYVSILNMTSTHLRVAAFVCVRASAKNSCREREQHKSMRALDLKYRLHDLMHLFQQRESLQHMCGGARERPQA